MDKSKGYKDNILGEQVRLVIKQSMTMQIGSFLSALILCFTVRNIVPRANIIEWLMTVLALVFGRSVLYYRFLKVDERSFVAERWKNVYLFLALFSGIVWGLSAFMIFPVGNLWQMALFVIVIAGLSAGSTTSHAGIKWGSAAWVVPVLLLYALRCVMEGGEFDYILGLLLVIFMAAMVLHSLKNNEAITSAMSLKFENIDLLADIRESEERFRALAGASFEGMIISQDGIIKDCNEQLSRMLGFSKEELLDKQIRDLVPSEMIERVMGNIKSGPDVVYEHDMLCKDGSRRSIEAHGATTRYHGNEYRITAIHDITERKEAEKQIRYLAYYDSLTGLPNRTFYKKLASRALLLAKRHNWTIAILFIDLDNFKRINDTFGHDAGDQLLRTVGNVVKTCIRKSDYIARSEKDELGNIVSRLGGDEFIVLLNEIAHPEDASVAAMRILNELGRPFNLAGHEVFVTASIGIALFPLDGADTESLLNNADVAMYHAKNVGRNNYQFYTKSMSATALHRLDLETDLKATDNI